MASAIGTILRQATKSNQEKYNVLTASTHERYQTGLAKTAANFYLLNGKDIKEWRGDYAKLPDNHVILNKQRGNYQIPTYLNFDFAISQHKFGQYQLLSAACKQLQLPLISLEHTLPVSSWGQEQLNKLKSMRGHINVFISEYSRAKWGWKEDEAEVVHHGVDTDLFCGNPAKDKQKVVLSVVNDWVNRDWCCGFKLWQEVTQGLPVKVLGDTPGLSKPAKDVYDLVDTYQSSQVFLNTSLVSPIPSVVLEAMSCGMACVSTANCMIPEIIKNGENGLISNNPKELHDYCQMLLSDPLLCKKLGDNARNTILAHFSLEKFVENWTKVFDKASQITYCDHSFKV